MHLLAIDIDRPTSCRCKLIAKAQLRKLPSPNVQEVSQSWIAMIGKLNMNHPITGMGVQPVETRLIRSNPDALRDRDWFSINIDGDMGVDMIRSLFQRITTDAIYWRIGRI